MPLQARVVNKGLHSTHAACSVCPASPGGWVPHAALFECCYTTTKRCDPQCTSWSFHIFWRYCKAGLKLKVKASSAPVG